MFSWVTLFLKVIGFLRGLLDSFRSEMDKQAGRDGANAEALRRNAERRAEGDKVEAEAEAAHRANPNSDDGFDTSFRRD